MIEAHSQLLMQIQATHERSRPPRALDHFKSFARPRSHNTILIGALRCRNGAVIKCLHLSAGVGAARIFPVMGLQTKRFLRRWLQGP